MNGDPRYPLRPGNVHSAVGWEELPEIERQVQNGKEGRGSLPGKPTSQPTTHQRQRRNRKVLVLFQSRRRYAQNRVGNWPRANGYLALSTGGAFIPRVYRKEVARSFVSRNSAVFGRSQIMSRRVRKDATSALAAGTPFGVRFRRDGVIGLNRGCLIDCAEGSYPTETKSVRRYLHFFSIWTRACLNHKRK
jgi:hypothetical protein